MMGTFHLPRPATMRRIHVASALFAVVLVAVLVMRTSTAAFTATTDNTANLFAADSITLTDNDSGVAMFDVEDMVPGQTETSCITVTYTSGASTADVTLYGTASGNLADYLDVTIDYQDGDLSAFGDCTGFAADGPVFDGTLTDFATDHTDFASGAGTWAGVDDQDQRTFRFVVELQDDDDAQGETASADFVWEAQTN